MGRKIYDTLPDELKNIYDQIFDRDENRPLTMLEMMEGWSEFVTRSYALIGSRVTNPDFTTITLTTPYSGTINYRINNAGQLEVYVHVTVISTTGLTTTIGTLPEGWRVIKNTMVQFYKTTPEAISGYFYTDGSIKLLAVPTIGSTLSGSFVLIKA